MKKIFVVFIGVLFSVNLFGQNNEPFATHTFLVSSIKSVEATTSGGSISVNGNANLEAVVEMFVSPSNNNSVSYSFFGRKRQNNCSDKEIGQILEEDYTIEIKVEDGKLYAVAKHKNRLENQRIIISFKISVPKQVSGNLQANYGNISVINLNGSQTLKTGGGALTVQNVSGDIAGTTSHGNITVNNSDGSNIVLSSGGGRVTVTDCSGNTNIRTSHGNIRLINHVGDAKVTSGGGSLTVQDVSGAIEGTTSHGNIIVTNLRGNTIDLSSGGGSVTVTDCSGATNMRTSHGNVRLTNHVGNIKVTSGGGALTVESVSGAIEGTTSHGNITVTKLDGSNIVLNSGGGSITITDCNGNSNVRTSHGAIRITNHVGSISANTGGGGVTANNIKGSLITQTSHGSMNLNDISGSLEATSSGGGIIVTMQSVSKHVKLSTKSGTVNLTLPDANGYNLNVRGNNVNTSDLRNFSGKVENNKLEGMIANGGALIDVNTPHGVSLSFK